MSESSCVFHIFRFIWCQVLPCLCYTGSGLYIIRSCNRYIPYTLVAATNKLFVVVGGINSNHALFLTP